jgi:transcriptional regulator of acetoin/glycerol metabolism
MEDRLELGRELLHKIEQSEEEERYRSLRDQLYGLGPVVIPILRENLTSHHYRRRMAAATNLGRLGHAQSVADLVLLINDPQASVREMALFALGILGDPSVVEAVVGALHDYDADVRYRALVALGDLGHPHIEEVLIRAMNDESYGVREQALSQLRAVGTPNAIVVVLRSLLEREQEMQQAAEEILDRIVPKMTREQYKKLPEQLSPRERRLILNYLEAKNLQEVYGTLWQRLQLVSRAAVAPRGLDKYGRLLNHPDERPYLMRAYERDDVVSTLVDHFMDDTANRSILLVGEAGTGKALVASAIHKGSTRSRRSLIHFKCSALTTDAIEAELFGQIRGAFPGALRDKPGVLELAHDGTLFLDDVDELPLNLQGRLLHALQERIVTRLGDTRTRAIDLRVIAASRRNLETLARRGRFREELLMFLNVFPITCLPLRDRREDIPALAAHFLKLSCKRLSIKLPMISKLSMEKLVAYDWPGNVRELQNVMDRGSIISTGGKLQIDLAATPPQGANADQTILSEAQMAAAQRNNLISALRRTRGKVAGEEGAAQLLGLQPTTLYSRIKKMQIGDDEWD